MCQRPGVMAEHPARRILRQVGLEIIRSTHPAAAYLRHAPATAFESILLRTFPDLTGLTFVQIGANDGVRCDPIHRFIDRYAWSGVLLEPLPVHFEALRRLHGANPRLRLMQAALDVEAGTRPIYNVRASGLPDWAQGLASLDLNRVRQAARDLGLDESAVTEEMVTTVTWQEVWSSLHQRRCDLLLLDTEGYDIHLLRQARLEQHRPRIVHFEHACVSDEERIAFYRELLALGYEISTHGVDTTAHLPE